MSDRYDEIRKIHPSTVEPEPLHSPQSAKVKDSGTKQYIIWALVTALLLFLMFQQMQISQLQNDIKFLSREWRENNENKTADLAARLDATEAKLEMMDSKIAYIQTGLAATAQKAEVAASQVEQGQENQEQDTQQSKEGQVCLGPLCIR